MEIVIKLFLGVLALVTFPIWAPFLTAYMIGSVIWSFVE